MLRTVIRYTKVYIHYIKMQSMFYFTYRQGLIMGLLVDFSHSLITIVFFHVLYRNVSSIAGWSYDEMLVFVGINMFSSFAVFSTVAIRNLRHLPEKIKNGTVDLVLSRPLSSMFVLSFEQPYVVGLFGILPGIYLVSHGFYNSSGVITVQNLLASAYAFICGYVIAVALHIAVVSLSFRWINATTLPKIIEKLFTSYKFNPRQVYQGFARLFFTIVFPAVFMSSVPAEFLLGGIGLEWLVFATVIALISLFCTIKVWNFMIKGYTSAGG
ncbi:hypothetical protein GF389_05420 [Candidatus Dojkabacteria bacterium]|nr:hypothetical protein [Candidatus Dojkabacteria bacterium]